MTLDDVTLWPEIGQVKKNNNFKNNALQEPVSIFYYTWTGSSIKQPIQNWKKYIVNLGVVYPKS